MLETNPPLPRMAMLSVHTSPLAALGQKKTGGMNVYVRELSRELARRGVLVDVFTRATEARRLYVREDHRTPGFRVIHVPAGPARPLSTDVTAVHLAEFTDGVAQFTAVEGLHYDLIHSHYWLSGLAAEQLRRHWGALPIVYMYHTLGPMKNRIARSPAERASAARLAGEKRVAWVADRIIAATSSEREQIQHFYGVPADRIALIPPGADLNRFHPVSQKWARSRLGLPFSKRLVLFVGRIEPLKGVDTLLRAMALLQQGYPELAAPVRGVVIGGDPGADPRDEEMARLQDLHRQLDLGDRVLFLGAKHQQEIALYYAAADIVVVPSLYESFGMVALEAMAMGTPVIASNVGGLTHLIEDGETGYLIPPGAPDVLTVRLLDLLLDERLRLRMGCRARRRAQNYTWRSVVDRVLAVYTALMSPAVAMAA